MDNVFTPDLIMEQYDYHGTLINGFINSILGQRDVTITTQGYNYIAMNDDVYVYTGVTSANADQSNLGFLLSNQRTKETKFYDAPGATEYAARISAMGVVQDLGYMATFPLLLNIADQPTYFIPLKDQANLVKSYAMVNVARYDIVATADTVTACEQEYIRLLSDRGVTETEELPQTEASRPGGGDPLGGAGGEHLLLRPPGGGGGLLRPVRRGQPHRRDPQRGGSGDHHPCGQPGGGLHPGRLHPHHPGAGPGPSHPASGALRPGDLRRERGGAGGVTRAFSSGGYGRGR